MTYKQYKEWLESLTKNQLMYEYDYLMNMMQMICEDSTNKEIKGVLRNNKRLSLVLQEMRVK